MPAVLTGWGGGEAASVSLARPRGAEEARATVEQWRSRGQAGARGTGAIARGMGRSYGDAAQLRGGLVLELTRLKEFQLDPEHGTVCAQAGVTIGELLRGLVPRGWMVPVVPGTQHVTVGGAIASDIHGKNHATAGTFGSYVSALGLLTASGEVRELRRGSEDGLFEATIGGMGLTGVILWARIALRPVTSALLSVDVDRVSGLDEVLALLGVPGGPHRVAWLDLLGSRPGRGIVTRAQHLEGAIARTLPDKTARRAGATVRERATVPASWPGRLLRPSTGRAFNEVWYRRAPRRARGRVESLGRHLFPLDALDAWPRLYGRQGLLQYQFAVPERQEQILYAVIERLRRAHIPCFLAVLKDLGVANDAPLSFPMAGWTLTLDLPRAASGLEPALAACDELVASADGRVYLTKDARLRPDAVRAMYPRLEQWKAARERADPDHLWCSDLGLRTGLVSADRR